MLSRSKNINPLDLQPKVAIGVSLPFNGSAVFRSTYTTREQIKSNIINYLLTNKNERIFNNRFGSNLRANLFEQIIANDIENVRNIISDDFSLYFPFVDIVNLNILGSPDQNLIRISLTVSINDENEEINLDFLNE
jgi:phage baseplate assembly protein W